MRDCQNMESALTDTDLIDRYRGGDVPALEALVERYRRPLFAFIHNMTEGRLDADEIFQEVWFRVLRNLATYEERNFLGWLMRIARNLVIDRVRRRKPSVSLDQEAEEGGTLVDRLASPTPGPYAEAEGHELGQRIAAAVRALPVEQREVFLLRVEGEVPFKEIARMQRVSINTALARMHYAVGKLRETLGGDYRLSGRHGEA